ncbi:hypothetical protein BDQ12DRAFT_674930 [Crucibulum laeve]|uniref:Metal homeostatis protein bsd2 n=1 Tax=Crucibulum laeve TaxID=68775 RepID=A0A5C3MDW1_9AGAR|nr:hypothetical protein BDQ12DRAFT_674930 [Crucibulum laeve]
MSSGRYAPLPNLRTARNTQVNGEMEAAFDYSEDEDDEYNTSESRPLNPAPRSPTTSLTTQQPHQAGTYDFENVDYDYPPPGSPPPPSSVALPNDHGNSNGQIPSFNAQSVPGRQRMWFQRVSGFLPQAIANRIGLGHYRPVGPVGGGTNNDGVFANVTAKPAVPVRVQDGDDTYIVPEDARQEAPPSYASAQADAVPPYWETTVHAPFSPDSIGEMIIDSLPTGSLFTFVWNLAVSVSFQFIGFLLTYLMHTSHAARLGSRAGLGITLINYGFALRSRLDATDGSNPENNGWGEWDGSSGSHPTFGSAAEADAWYNHGGSDNSTSMFPNLTEDQANTLVTDATTEWLSFFLMTVGWFILLTSVLGFWRVKRWEHGIMASQRGASSTTPEPESDTAVGSQLERMFALRGISRGDLFRQGFGFGRRDREEDEATRNAIRAEEGEAIDAQETDSMIPSDQQDPERARLVAEAHAREMRLRTELRDAGFI